MLCRYTVQEPRRHTGPTSSFVSFTAIHFGSNHYHYRYSLDVQSIWGQTRYSSVGQIGGPKLQGLSRRQVCYVSHSSFLRQILLYIVVDSARQPREIITAITSFQHTRLISYRTFYFLI
jgi:hypothetical protein